VLLSEGEVQYIIGEILFSLFSNLQIASIIIITNASNLFIQWE